MRPGGWIPVQVGHVYRRPMHRGFRRTAVLAVVAIGSVACTTPEPAPSDTSAPATTSSAADLSQVFAKLRARSLVLPDLPPGAACGTSRLATHVPGIPAQAALQGTSATNPVYTVNEGIPRLMSPAQPETGASTTEPWGNATVLWLSDPSYRGPVLVRGQRLDGPQAVGFGRSVHPGLELRLPPGSWDESRSPLTAWGLPVHPPSGWRVAVAQTRVRVDGCYGYQVDGTSFSYDILFPVVFYKTW